MKRHRYLKTPLEFLLQKFIILSNLHIITTQKKYLIIRFDNAHQLFIYTSKEHHSIRIYRTTSPLARKILDRSNHRRNRLAESNNVIIIFRGEGEAAARKTNRRGQTRSLSANKSKGTSGMAEVGGSAPSSLPLPNRSTKSEGTVNEGRGGPRHDPKEQVVCRYLHTMSTGRGDRSVPSFPGRERKTNGAREEENR